jgi:hypothetical protein
MLPKPPDALAHFERLIKTAEKLNREIDVVKKAAEIANNIGSFESRHLLSRARDDLVDALLKIREAQRIVAKSTSAPGLHDEDD